MLAENYQHEQNVKDARKFQIVRSCKVLQRWFRHLRKGKEFRACRRIQRAWRRFLKTKAHNKRRIKKLQLLQRQAATKIQKAFRRYRHLKNKPFLSTMKYDPKLVVKLQSLVRRQLQSKPNHLLRFYKHKAVQKNYLKNLKLHKGVLQQQAISVHLVHDYQMRR